MSRWGRCFCCNNELDRANQMFCSKSCRRKFYRGTLTLPIKKCWFDMILSGEKVEEYREMKSYWETRFGNYFSRFYDFSKDTPSLTWSPQKKDVIFRNGYGKDAPEFTAECTLSEGYGKEEWGAESGVKYYILTIHRVYNVKNVE